MATPELVTDQNATTERSFDPRTDISADAKYIVKHLVLWFLVFPPLLALFIWVFYGFIQAMGHAYAS